MALLFIDDYLIASIYFTNLVPQDPRSVSLVQVRPLNQGSLPAVHGWWMENVKREGRSEKESNLYMKHMILQGLANYDHINYVGSLFSSLASITMQIVCLLCLVNISISI